MANTVQSRKAKGRRLQQQVRDDVIRTFGLSELDVRSTSMGASGTDVMLSQAGIEAFPFSTECKNNEKLNIWSALSQAESNTVEGTEPLVVFKRNGSETYACLRWEALLGVLRCD